MQTTQDFAGCTDMWSTSAGGHLMKVVNLTGFTVQVFFYLIEQYSKFLSHILQALQMCTLCVSTNFNTIIEFVPNCLQHVSGDGFNGRSDSYLQFRDTCRKRRNINLILDVTPQKEITWGCIWRTRWPGEQHLIIIRQSFRTTLHMTSVVIADVSVKCTVS